MGWFLLIVAIVGLAFPPLAFVLLALMVMGVFAKGMDVTAASRQDVDGPERRTRGGRDARRLDGERVDQVMEAAPEVVIDVPWYPIPPSEQLSAPIPESLDGLPKTR